MFQERFLAHKDLLQHFSCLTATNETPTSQQKIQIRELAEIYEEDVNCSPDTAEGELISWYRYLSAMKERPKTPLELLSVCNKNAYAAIWKLLQILCTLPVTTAEAERSFSYLRILKSYLRNTMTEDRLNGLALLYIHRDIPVEVDEVLDEMAQKTRRLDIGRIH